ncbi:ABC transporter ATP-binding protein [Acetobacterium sp.]|uniref:ABC transporter ATP-binding protein n=1 Tax=Acetobacterium sp. TaxID=1872094 RepID=UPI0027209B4F|nr:ABC transporter ATP-binding protein [Acetobacterium sp.]MDO9492348.1 ABC transporter ATP-binding protein [Acetobacterium sp.]
MSVDKQTNKMSGFKIMKRLAKEIKPVSGYMGLCITGGILGQLTILGTLVAGVGIICTYAGIDMMLSIGQWLVALFICAVLRGPSRYLEQYFGHHVAYKLLAIMRVKIYDNLRKLSPAKMLDKKNGDVVSTAISDIECIEIFFAHTVAPIAIAVVITILSLILCAVIWPMIALVMLPFYLIIGIVIPIFSARSGRDTGRAYRSLLGDLKSYLIDSLKGIKEIIVFGKGLERLSNIDKKGNEINGVLHKLIRHRNFVMALPDLGRTLARVAVMAICSYGMMIGEVGIGGAAVLMVVLASSFTPVIAISGLSGSLLQTFAAAERVFALEDEKPQVADPVNPKKMGVNSGEICFNNIGFTYPTRPNVVIDDFNMTAQKGEKIAFVGESGSGKSTALRLLLRYWDPNEGEILVGGTNIKDLTLKDCRNNFAMLSQDTWLMNDTIEENIRIGNPNATHEEVVEAAKRACIHEFIENLPDGYQSNAGEMGSRLSGGERQRIGIARVCLRNTPIMILDEPTSSLDTLNEKSILKTLYTEFKDRTIITVSHRASTVAGCDRVYRLDTN